MIASHRLFVGFPQMVDKIKSRRIFKWLRKLTWICELLHKKKKAQPADEEILRLDVSVGEEQKVIDAL